MRSGSQAGLVAGLLSLTAACSSPVAEKIEVPLFDRQNVPTVLLESRSLAPPPDVGPNRFVRGWRGWRREAGTVWLLPSPEARLELVDLEARPRRLVFDGERLTDEEVWLEVSVGGESRRVRVADRFEVELPPAGEAGRRLVDLRLETPGGWAVRAVAVEPSMSGGAAECAEGTCAQSGPSLIEAVRRVQPGTRLAGVFAPPRRPEPGQRFSIVASEQDGSDHELFSWEGSWRDRFSGSRPIDVEIPLTGEADWVRLHFVAEGGGSPAQWRDLRLGRPRSSSTASPVAPSVPGPPRLVVLYVMDAMRADHVSALGGEPGLTPVIDRLAAEGAAFRAHRSPAPNTLPSTKTLFTGETFLLRGGWKLAADGPETLAEVYTRSGFRTAIFSGNGNASADFGTDRGFEHADASLLKGRPGYGRDGPGYNDSAARIHRAALGWLDTLGADESAFVYLHTIHPHAPYEPPPDLERRFTAHIDSKIASGSRQLRDIGLGRYLPTAAERERLIRLYAASVAYNDRELGLLLTELASRYEPGEVLLVLTSDHGEELFDHGGVLHGYTLYEEVVHIPLVVWWPGTVAPNVVDAPSGTVDAHDALRALVDKTHAASRPGLWRHLSSREPRSVEPPIQFAAASAVPGGIFSARTARWKLIWAPREGVGWGMGSAGGRSRDVEYLFDLTADGERSNLSGERHAEADWLRSRLRGWVESGLAREVGGEVPDLDEGARERLRALGYLD